MSRTSSAALQKQDNALDAPIPSGFETWFRAGRAVRSAWGKAQSGIYLLELSLPKDTRIQVGALGRWRFPAGRFLYVGRAMRGLEARLARHLRKIKARPRWHIDHLRAQADLLNLWVFPTADPASECETASKLLASGGQVEIRGFGSSDCLCPSHLLFYPF
jgi:Uri superfamily endonuclease